VITIKQCPVGPWSTPLVDLFVVLKAAVGFGSKRILELGSFRGYTARLLAENTGPNSSICAVDVDERHGASYRGLEVEKKIRRKTGTIARSLFEEDEKFDLIFVDANHEFDSVMGDTQLAFDLLAPEGVILWHDYVFDSYFHGLCAVPEALREFSHARSIYAVRSTSLAIYSEARGWETAKLSSAKRPLTGSPAWDEPRPRG